MSTSPGFLDHHRETAADASMVVVPADGRSDCGFVLLEGPRPIEKVSMKNRLPAEGASTSTPAYISCRSRCFSIYLQ